METQIEQIEGSLAQLQLNDYPPAATEPAELPACTPTPAGRPCRPSEIESISLVEVNLLKDDLSHLRTAFLNHSISFTLSCRSLRFIHPTSSAPYVRYDLGSEEGYNHGQCALDPRHPGNKRFIVYHTWLIITHESLPQLPPGAPASLSHGWSKMASQLREEIERLEDMKEIEWEAQQYHRPAVTDDEGYRDVDTSALW